MQGCGSLFAVADHYGRVPAVDKSVGRGCEGALCDSVVLVPECSTHIPVGKPHFLGFEILRLGVEDAGVSQERGEALVVVACKPIYGEAAVACAGGAYAGRVYGRFVGFHIIDGA